MTLSKGNTEVIEAYILANKLLIIGFLVILFYPTITQYFNTGFDCEYKNIYGTECRSCGLTRGLRECFHGNFNKAVLYNSQSVFVFSSLLFQLSSRMMLISVSIFKQKIITKYIRPIFIADVIILLILFVTNLIYYG